MPELEEEGNIIREEMSDKIHQIWTRWMQYLFSKCWDYPTGGKVIPQEFVKRWQRQIATSYEDLPENEKDSDRDIADELIGIFFGE